MSTVVPEIKQCFVFCFFVFFLLFCVILILIFFIYFFQSQATGFVNYLGQPVEAILTFFVACKETGVIYK